MDSGDLETLKVEVRDDPLGLKLQGASPGIVASLLNEYGTSSDSVFVVPDIPMRRLKTELLAELDFNELATFRTWKAAGSDPALAVQELFDAADNFDVSHPRLRQMIELIYTENVITLDTKERLLALGTIRRSRAEELIGRKITVEEAEEVLNG